MNIRAITPEDLPIVLDLTVATFGPFYETVYRNAVGDVVLANRHGDWREDYRRHVAGIVDPSTGRSAAAADDGGELVGYVAWINESGTAHGEIDILAVAEEHRGRGVGRALAEHAIAALKAAGADVVSIGTGGDDFHAPARALYSALGFTPFPNVSFTKAI